MFKSALKFTASIVTKVPLKTVAATAGVVGAVAGLVGANGVENTADDIKTVANSIDNFLEKGIELLDKL
jgi:hypothetical protein